MKKFVAMLLACLMVVGMLAGCGSSKTAKSTALRIGMIGPLTGDAAVYGNAVKVGMEIAVEEINAKDGLKIELNCQDDAHDAEKSVNAYNTLKDWGMQILGGTVTTNPCRAVAPEAAKDRIFVLTPSASAEDVVDSGDNVFQLCFSDPNQGAGSANLIADRNMAQAIAIIYDASDAYSSGIYESFMEVAAAKGLNVVCETSFTGDSKSDLSTQVAQCKDAGADLVFLPFYYTEAAQVLVQADKIGYDPIFFGCDGMDGILDVEGFDTALAEGLMMMTPFAADAKDEATQSFVAKYKEKTGGVPNQFAADAYDVVYALYKACTAAGIDGTTPNAEACDKLIAQFTTMSFDGLTGAGMTWDSNGFVSKVPTAVKIENGAYVGID